MGQKYYRGGASASILPEIKSPSMSQGLRSPCAGYFFLDFDGWVPAILASFLNCLKIKFTKLSFSGVGLSASLSLAM